MLPNTPAPTHPTTPPTTPPTHQPIPTHPSPPYPPSHPPRYPTPHPPPHTHTHTYTQTHKHIRSKGLNMVCESWKSAAQWFLTFIQNIICLHPSTQSSTTHPHPITPTHPHHATPITPTPIKTPPSPLPLPHHPYPTSITPTLPPSPPPTPPHTPPVAPEPPVPLVSNPWPGVCTFVTQTYNQYSCGIPKTSPVVGLICPKQYLGPTDLFMPEGASAKRAESGRILSTRVFVRLWNNETDSVIQKVCSGHNLAPLGL